MFKELDKYKVSGKFTYKPGELLRDVCNAIKDGSGVYVVCTSLIDESEIIYIGSSGKMQNDGSIQCRENGLYGRIVKGKQFDERRSISWPAKMKEEGIEAIDVYWYQTYTDEIRDIPAYVEAVLIQRFFDLYKQLPRWNVKY